MSAHSENEARIRANRRMGFRTVEPPNVLCPGCGIGITTGNAGGYRTYCDQCVDVFPALPADQGGYEITGRYPRFKWKRVSD